MRIHRIWSTDWWRHPDRELNRCCAATESASSGRVQSAPNSPPPSSSNFTGESVQLRLDNGVNDRAGQPLQETEREAETPPYVRAALRWPLYQEILDTPTWQIVDYVKQVVDAEAPIHIEEITTRLREAAGKARAGRQIREHVLTAINVADRLGTFERRGNFAHSPGQTQYVVRSRAGFSQQSKRIDYIAPEEIMQAAIEILREAVAVEIGGLARPVGNKLGFERVTSEITQHLDSVIGTAVESEKVILSGGKYRLP